MDLLQGVGNARSEEMLRKNQFQAAKPFKDRLKDSLLTSFLFLLQRLKVF